MPRLAAQVSFKCVRYFLYRLCQQGLLSQTEAVANENIPRFVMEDSLSVESEYSHRNTLRLRLQIGKKKKKKTNFCPVIFLGGNSSQ